MTDLETIEKWERFRQELGFWRSLVTAPKPPVKALATMKMLDSIFADSDKAMTLSSSLAKAFAEAGIELEDDETFACMMCVVKRPKYLSYVMGQGTESWVEGPTPEPSVRGPTPEPSVQVARMAMGTVDDFPFMELSAKAWRSIRYNAVMEPAIMKRIMERKDRDRIRY